MVDLKLQIPDSFFEEENRLDYLVTKDIKQLWAVELDLLYEFQRVCDKYGLKYYADSGTLLGAIRHKGFIPWDDDIDIVMKREDYDRLIEIGDKEFNHPYFFQTPYSDNGYLKGHAQLRNSDTAAILPRDLERVNYNQGIFLDIFPIDLESKYSFVNSIKCRVLSIFRSSFSYIYNPDPPNGVKYKFVGLLASMVEKNPITAYSIFDWICKTVLFNGHTVDKISYYWEYKNYKMLPINWFGEITMVPFEFLSIPVPVEYNKILSRYYGIDYMKPVIEKGAHQVGGKLIISTDESYKSIINKS